MIENPYLVMIENPCIGRWCHGCIYVMGRVPTYDNQLQGLGCALLASRGTQAVTGVGSLAPFVLIEHTLVKKETSGHVFQYLMIFDL